MLNFGTESFWVPLLPMNSPPPKQPCILVAFVISKTGLVIAPKSAGWSRCGFQNEIQF